MFSKSKANTKQRALCAPNITQEAWGAVKSGKAPNSMPCKQLINLIRLHVDCFKGNYIKR